MICKSKPKFVLNNKKLESRCDMRQTALWIVLSCQRLPIGNSRSRHRSGRAQRKGTSAFAIRSANVSPCLPLGSGEGKKLPRAGDERAESEG